MGSTLVDSHYDSSIQTEEKYGSDFDGKTAEENAKCVKFYGPWGGCGGCPWNDGCLYTGVRQIVLTYGDCINSICVTYDKNCVPIPAPKHGGNGCYCTTVKLNWPCEYLVSISGYYGCKDGIVVVRSLTFTTNQRTFGPFGVQTGTPFCSPSGGKIVGFAGRSGSYIDQIGVYVSTA